MPNKIFIGGSFTITISNPITYMSITKAGASHGEACWVCQQVSHWTRRYEGKGYWEKVSAWEGEKVDGLTSCPGPFLLGWRFPQGWGGHGMMKQHQTIYTIFLFQTQINQWSLKSLKIMFGNSNPGPKLIKFEIIEVQPKNNQVWKCWRSCLKFQPKYSDTFHPFILHAGNLLLLRKGKKGGARGCDCYLHGPSCQHQSRCRDIGISHRWRRSFAKRSVASCRHNLPRRREAALDRYGGEPCV